jgi:hypothetical protein
MAKNTVKDLRDHLFETLEALKDPEPDKAMPLERAKMICEVAQTIINSAKVEVDLLKAVSGTAPEGGFFNLPDETRMLRKPQFGERLRITARDKGTVG